MNEVQMKALLKTLKNEKQFLSSVPEPDSGFEKRMIKSLRASPEWKRESLWSQLNVFRFEFSVWRMAGAFAAVVALVAVVKIYDGTQGTYVASENRRSHPELASMIQRGGERALNAWMSINGDVSAQENAEMPVNAPSNDDEQKRILAELEKKWAPAL